MKLKVAVVGATGAVGKQLLSILEQRNFPVSELVPFASERSKGKEIKFAGRSIPCRVLEKGCFKGIDMAFFDASDTISKEWVPEAAREGTWVVDNSATYRMHPETLLIVPEVNGELLDRRLQETTGKAEGLARVVAGPNCSTAQLVVALKPLHDKYGIKRVVVSSYQSTSGAGAAAMDELLDQLRTVMAGQPARPQAFAHQIAFNCIPHIGGFKDDGYTSEEQKIIQESRKLMSLPKLRITATAVRVPTLACHGEAVNVEFERQVDVSDAREALRRHPGVIVQDEPAKAVYPMGATSPGDLVEAAGGRDAVYVGRIRRDESVDSGLCFWVVSDNLRKGAALNAVQIGERILESLRSRS
jgi:aspartate-semialdehyde dehydrogenase